jgi:hypothetical protein
MADDKRQEANERLKKFGAMSLEDVAVCPARLQLAGILHPSAAFRHRSA